jgi:hypothetical protein
MLCSVRLSFFISSRSPAAAYEITAVICHKSEKRVFRPNGLTLPVRNIGSPIRP